MTDKFGELSQRFDFVTVYDLRSLSGTKCLFFKEKENDLLKNRPIVVAFSSLSPTIFVRMDERDCTNVVRLLKNHGPTINGLNALIRSYRGSIVNSNDVESDNICVYFTSLNNASLYTSGKLLFRGTLQQLNSYVNNDNELNGKVVKFRYRSGSKPGGVRVVKVEKYDGYYLEGTDAAKGEYRKYTVGQIVGGKSAIEVLA